MTVALSPALDLDREKIAAVCRANRVRTLDLFGSAVTDRFDPQHSDIDLLVTFDVPDGSSMLDPFFSLRHAQEGIVGRKVGLTFDGDMKNPYFKASVDWQRHRLYP